jgi:response regulator of citrate/malate metabolism
LGVVDWFVKPLDRDRFVQRLRAALPEVIGEGSASQS